MLKILIIGLGSIGRRHLKHLQTISGLQLAALRTSKGTLNENVGIIEFYTEQEALNYKPDGVLISNPTSLHVSSALPFLEMGCKVLIEKPIDDSIEEAIVLEKYAPNIRVAYCLRFLQLSIFLESIIQKEGVQKISFKRSFYLPKWHPYADYRKEYTARKDLGGGVIRTLSHEIDLMIKWLGSPINVTGITDKISLLDIDTDDFAFFTCKMTNGTRVNFELDFLSPVNINIGELYTPRGKYFWDMKKVEFIPFDSDKPVVVFESQQNDFDTMYQNQMNDFVQFIQDSKSKNATFEEAIEVLKTIERVEK